MRLTDRNHSELNQICTERRNCEIEVSDEILGFSSLTSTDFSKSTEVPPTSTAFLEKHFVNLILHCPNDLKGSWMRFVLFVYADGGKIFFTKADDNYYKAAIQWK